MGKKWDGDKGGRDQWIDWLTTVMEECLRVIKPGGMVLVWAIPRTSHWTATAIENAGFEIRDKIYHLFGSGFPKSADISKNIDKKLGKERKVVGKRGHPTLKDKSKVDRQESTQYHATNPTADEWDLTEPNSDEARLFDGYGTAMKPAAEEWVLAMKPIEKTFADNALTWGIAGINVDAGRIRTNEVITNHSRSSESAISKGKYGDSRKQETHQTDGQKQGRWPANLILEHHPECVKIGTKEVKGIQTTNYGKHKTQPGAGGTMGRGWNGDKIVQGYADQNGNETIEEYQCHPDCPIRLLNEQVGIKKSGLLKAGHPYGQGDGQNVYALLSGTVKHDTHADEGYVSRYFKNLPPDTNRIFYSPKASRKERNKGCENLDSSHTLGPMAGRGQEGLKCKNCGKWKASGSPCKCTTPDFEKVPFKRPLVQNSHPTVKSLALMKYLCTLFQTPTKGIILDPFGGSGTTGVACEQLGIPYILIEKDSEYCKIARARIKAANDPEPIKKTKKRVKQKNTQPGLFNWDDLDTKIE